jgi:hypothetical protein
MMATPITVSAFRSIVESSLNKVFDEVYDTYMGIDQYMTEVEFDGQDESRNAYEATHASTSK